MWLYMIVLALVILGLLGGALLGGVFTIVLITLALIVAIAAIGYSVVARAAQPDPAAGSEPGGPLPTGQQAGGGGRVPATPERLADARRAQQ